MFEELTLPLPRSTPDAAASAVDLPALVHTHASTLFRVAHALLRNRAEAEDTVQDTFLRVLQHQHDLPAVRDLRPWLVRITWNLALDRRRRTRRFPTDQAESFFFQSLSSPQTPTDHALHAAGQATRVLAAIDRLPGPERQALLLSAIQELETTEIAHTMQKSESAVRALIHRTRLRRRLGDTIDSIEQGRKR